MIVQWYPGHMAKAKRLLEENLKAVNVVVELCDARMPFSSRNPEIDKIIGNKTRILVFNKADLADEKYKSYWTEYYKNKGFSAVFTDAKNGDGVKKVIDAVTEAMAEKAERQKEKGRISTTVYAMIVGIPNVGKSSFINKAAGKSLAVTGDKPGVTRDKQWLKINEDMYLLDTPGMLWPRLENQFSALKLAACGSIKDDVVDLGELCAFVLTFLEDNYPGVIDKRFGIDTKAVGADEDDEYDYITGCIIGGKKLKRGLMLLEACGRSRGCLIKGGEVDTERISKILLDELRGGKIGNITMDLPGCAEEDVKIRADLAQRVIDKQNERKKKKSNGGKWQKKH